MQHKPKKSLGQNFLHDANVAHKIIRAFNPQPSDKIIEIGPGKGALTALLLQTLPHVTVIELDKSLIPTLQEQFGDKITIIHNDVLKVNFSELQKEPQKRLRVLGNIPYYITTPILFHIIEARNAVSDFTVMMQTEVAQRIVAKPRQKDYGILSIFLQYYCTPKILFAVSKNSFFPVPQVSSTVVQLNFAQPHFPQANNDNVFRAVVRGTFGKRRKTLRNGLRSMEIPLEELEKLSIDLELRPEELRIDDFIQLSNELSHLSELIITPAKEEREDGE